MIKVKIRDQREKEFNGLEVFLNVVEEGAAKCDGCKRDGESAIKRTFEIARAQRGAVSLRPDTDFFHEVERFVLAKMGSGRSLCFECFDGLVEDAFGGYGSVD